MEAMYRERKKIASLVLYQSEPSVQPAGILHGHSHVLHLLIFLTPLVLLPRPSSQNRTIHQDPAQLSFLWHKFLEYLLLVQSPKIY